MKKKIKLIIICVLAVIMVFANMINVFAANRDWSDLGGTGVIFVRQSSPTYSRHVYAIQLVLRYHSPSYLSRVDGGFGYDTENGVIDFQNKYKLLNDGRVGSGTKKELNKRLISAGGTAYYTNYRPGVGTTSDYFSYAVSPQKWSFRQTTSSSYETLQD